MAPSSSNNSLDFSAYAAKTVGILVSENRLEESLKSFEDEKRKMEAFNRELPLCMKLITTVIDELKKEMRRLNRKRFNCVLEEFMPVKSKWDEKWEQDSVEKKSWMSSAQLWNDNSTNTDERKSNKIHDCINKNNGSTSDRRSKSKPRSCEKMVSSLPDLSLASPMKEARQSYEKEHKIQTTRKTRRCWSPELHRRFLAALHQLGGTQVATPKQIKELMKVDGLTNDEVKSHLQKYRLHTQRITTSSASLQKPTVAMGGRWASLENCSSTSSQLIVSQSGFPESPLQLTVSDRTISTAVEDEKSEGYSWK